MIEETKIKNHVSHKYKSAKAVPNIEEIHKYREIQFLQHSNLFKMQIDEMITALEIKNKARVKLNSFFNALRELLQDLPQSKQFQLSNLKWLRENDIEVPLKEFSDLPPMNGVFTFIPPAEVLMVGSYPLDLSSTHSRVIDVALVLPKEFMQNNDIFNGKWIFRRMLYLCWLGKILQTKTDFISSVSWVYHAGIRLRPILQVTPAEKTKNYKFNLCPLPPEDFFKLKIISPIRSNVSPSWFYQRDKIEGKNAPSSPYHNWISGVDLVAMKHNKFIKEHLNHPNWIHGLQLVKIWLKQRNFSEGEGCVTSHLITMFVAYLAKGRKISPQMSPYQIFRTTLLHISNSDWSKEGPSLFEEETIADPNVVLPSAEDFHRLYSIVFIDPTGLFNIAGSVSLETYLQLRHEAKIGLEILELSSAASFDSLFICRTDFSMVFDHIVQITFTEDDIGRIFRNAKMEEAAAADHLGDVRPLVFSRVISLLSQGLGDRIDFIGILREREEACPFGSLFPDLSKKLTLGFLVNPRTNTGLLTKGPLADSPEAASFREFWGDLSSLRRFRDSTFYEAVLWMATDDPLGDRRLIVGKIVEAVLQNHFDISPSGTHCVANQLEDVLRLNCNFTEESFKYGTGEEAISLAIVSFDKLARKLRGLDLPLKVTSVQSVSDVLRHTIVFPPLPIQVPKPYVQKDAKRVKINKYKEISDQSQGCPLYRNSINVQIFLEISGKWPDDLVAIKSVKEEFLRKMSELLESEGITCVLHPSFLQIVWEGYIYNVEVCYRREIYLLRSPQDGSDAGDPKDTEDSIKLEKEIEILPRLTSSLNSLQTEYTTFGSSGRLIKRWVSSQLLLPHFPPTVIDLIVAYLFLQPYPYSPPNTPQVALLRFMKFVAHTDFKTTPIFVNLRNQFQGNDESELTKRFTNNRSSYPAMFICSPCELRPLAGVAEPTSEELNKRLKLASCWSRPRPSLLVLGRMKVVAGAALTAFQKCMWEKAFDFKVLYRPQLSDYDVLIYLNEYNLARRLERIDRRKPVVLQRYSHAKGEFLPVTDFDPAQLFLKELRNAFDNEALFFHDEHGGSVIGVLLKPHVSKEKEPKKCNFERAKIVGTNDIKIVTDVEAIVEEFRILGQGLIKEIKLKN